MLRPAVHVLATLLRNLHEELLVRPDLHLPHLPGKRCEHKTKESNTWEEQTRALIIHTCNFIGDWNMVLLKARGEEIQMNLMPRSHSGSGR